MIEFDDVEMSYGISAMAPEGRGLLQVTSKRLIWKEQGSETEAGAQGKVYEVDIPCITLHAISKDPSSFPKPCLYCQVCVSLEIRYGGEVDEAENPLPPSPTSTIAHISLLQISEGGEDEDEDEAKEVYFVPQDPESRKCPL